MSSERHLGQGVGPVQASVIDRWAERLGVSDHGMFRACVRAMDSAYLDHVKGGTSQEVVAEPMTPAMFAATYGKAKGKG